jgi:hypothetical protein
MSLEKSGTNQPLFGPHASRRFHARLKNPRSARFFALLK